MSEAKTHEDAIVKLRAMLKGIRFCMMTTLDEEGRLHSRPMATQEADFLGELWFITGRSTHKHLELQRDARVNLSYADPSANRYVSLSGSAELVDDRAKLDELWTVWHRTWFPQGKDDPDIVLIKVTVESAEYWDSDSPAVIHALGVVKATVTGKRPDAGEHATLDHLH